VGARVLGLRPLERNSTLFAVILNVFLSRNLDQSMLKNAYFFAVILNVFLSRNLDQSMLKNAYFLRKKNCKNHLSVGGSALRPQRCYSRLLLQLRRVCF